MKKLLQKLFPKKAKLYYISYAHSKGFGYSIMEETEPVTLEMLQTWMRIISNGTEPVIIVSYFEIKEW